MNTAALEQDPQGDDLTNALAEQAATDTEQQIKAKIQRGLDASNVPASKRTAHADFMAKLKAAIVKQIDAR